jgi:hypothetical protein
MSDADYKAFMNNGKEWDRLRHIGYLPSEPEMQSLQAQNDALRKKYNRDPSLGEYPKFHTGGESLTAGWAQILPGELVFPSSLSSDIKTLISVATGITGKSTESITHNTTDNRREIKIDKLLNIENNRMEDDVDSEIFARQLSRAVLQIS